MLAQPPVPPRASSRARPIPRTILTTPPPAGIVELESSDAVARAIAELTDTELGGRKLFVREDREEEVPSILPPPRAPRAAPAAGAAGGAPAGGRVTVAKSAAPGVSAVPGATAHISNLPYDITWKELKDIFAGCGKIGAPPGWMKPSGDCGLGRWISAHVHCPVFRPPCVCICALICHYRPPAHTHPLSRSPWRSACRHRDEGRAQPGLGHGHLLGARGGGEGGQGVQQGARQRPGDHRHNPLGCAGNVPISRQERGRTDLRSVAYRESLLLRASSARVTPDCPAIATNDSRTP